MELIKHIGNHGVSGLGDAVFDVFQGQAFDQSSQRNKLHAVAVYVDDGASRIVIVSVDDGIEQSFPQCILRMVITVFSEQPMDAGAQIVVQHQKGEGIVQLF